MQNKINQFKQLSQEFADRKGYKINFKELQFSFYCNFYPSNYDENKDRGVLYFDDEQILSFIFLFDSCDYEIFDRVKEDFILEHSTLDQFKKNNRGVVDEHEVSKKIKK